MEQLKMYWLPGTPIEEPELPEGYSFSNFNPETDIHAWAECLRNGRLITDYTDEEGYEATITRIDDICPEEDIWFLDYKGEHIGTVCAFVFKDRKIGDMHMVGIREDFRGRGLAKFLSYITLKHLSTKDIKFISLTTDEFRKAAVKSYLSAGFLPVEYDYGMQKRWKAILREYNVDSVQMLYNDGTPYKMLYAHSDEEPPVKIGVLGAGRGKTFMKFCKQSNEARLVAICDSDERCLQEVKELYGDEAQYYTDFDEFLKCGMDLVVLANYGNAHAPFAVKALKAGINVMSELLPVQTMKEAVELVEAAESSGKLYLYAENCCYMPAPKKMAKLFRTGKMGAFQYGEGEYLHNCQPDWHHHSHSERGHWRNTMSAFYYCTHATGPLIRMSGQRPVKVSGFEFPYNDKMFSMGALGAPFGVEIITLENGGLIKCMQGVGPVKNSLWFSCMGDRGMLETQRNLEGDEGVSKLYMKADKVLGSDDGEYSDLNLSDGLSEEADGFDHGGGDYYLMYNACQAVRGNKQADVVGIYEALDMFLPGMFAYFSALDGGKPQDIPDLRNPAERERFRNDTRCTDPAVAGSQLIPSNTKGNPDIPNEIYESLKQKLEADRKKEK